MASEWFYTTNKQQMGPVTWKELRELADGGILKPHDMVWTEGMDEWVKAVNQNGLFADEAEGAVTKPKKKSAYTEAKPPPARRSKRADEDDDEDEEEDARAEKRKARKRQQDRTKMAVGLKIFLILAGVVLLLSFVVCAGGLLFWWGFGGAGVGGGGKGRTTNYTINNLQPTRWEEKRFNFQQGQRVVITANSTVSRPGTDVDLWVFHGNAPDNLPTVADVSIGPNSRVEFVVPATGSYRVRIGNHGPGVANTTRVTVDER